MKICTLSILLLVLSQALISHSQVIEQMLNNPIIEDSTKNNEGVSDANDLEQQEFIWDEENYPKEPNLKVRIPATATVSLDTKELHIDVLTIEGQLDIQVSKEDRTLSIKSLVISESGKLEIKADEGSGKLSLTLNSSYHQINGQLLISSSEAIPVIDNINNFRIRLLIPSTQQYGVIYIQTKKPIILQNFYTAIDFKVITSDISLENVLFENGKSSLHLNKAKATVKNVIFRNVSSYTLIAESSELQLDGAKFDKTCKQFDCSSIAIKGITSDSTLNNIQLSNSNGKYSISISNIQQNSVTLSKISDTNRCNGIYFNAKITEASNKNPILILKDSQFSGNSGCIDQQNTLTFYIKNQKQIGQYLQSHPPHIQLINVDINSIEDFSKPVRLLYDFPPLGLGLNFNNLKINQNSLTSQILSKYTESKILFNYFNSNFAYFYIIAENPDQQSKFIDLVFVNNNQAKYFNDQECTLNKKYPNRLTCILAQTENGGEFNYLQITNQNLASDEKSQQYDIIFNPEKTITIPFSTKEQQNQNIVILRNNLVQFRYDGDSTQSFQFYASSLKSTSKKFQLKILNWEKYGFPLASLTSYPNSNQVSIIPDLSNRQELFCADQVFENGQDLKIQLTTRENCKVHLNYYDAITFEISKTKTTSPDNQFRTNIQNKFFNSFVYPIYQKNVNDTHEIIRYVSIYRDGALPTQLQQIQKILGNKFYIKEFLVQNVTIYQKARTSQELEGLGNLPNYIITLNDSDIIEPKPDPKPEPEPEPQPTPKPKESSNTWWIVLLIVSLIVIGGFVGYYFFKRKQLREQEGDASLINQIS